MLDLERNFIIKKKLNSIWHFIMKIRSQTRLITALLLAFSCSSLFAMEQHAEFFNENNTQPTYLNPTSVYLGLTACARAQPEPQNNTKLSRSRCRKCNPAQTFPSQEEYKKHYYEVHQLDQTPYTCRKCNPIQIFPNQKEYNQHYGKDHRLVKDHRSEAPHACRKCNPIRTFPNQKEYNQHYYEVHRSVKDHQSDQTPHNCKKCNHIRTFPNQKEYKAHYDKVHRSKKRKIDDTMHSQSNSVLNTSNTTKRFRSPYESPRIDQSAQTSMGPFSQEDVERILDAFISIPPEIADILRL